MSYLHNGIWDGFPVFWGTIIILGLFAALNLLGLSESANVAFLIFVMTPLMCVSATSSPIP